MSADLPKPGEWAERILSLDGAEAQGRLMLEAFHIQFAHNKVYRRFCTLVNRTPMQVNDAAGIPYLPAGFFRSEAVITGTQQSIKYFQSSGTTGEKTARHYYAWPELYEASFTRAFEIFYGPVNKYCILALLPSYLEQEHSSLVYMVENLIRASGHPLSGFFLHDQEALSSRLVQLEGEGQPTLLLGVTYALLDFAAAWPMKLNSTIVMETGGMKGRRKELIRKEVHEQLKTAFGLDVIHSEYGMTELFSQAYARQDGIFHSPPWMRVTIKEEDDPLGIEQSSGVLHIADLANLFSCCFIATEDRGRRTADGGFEVLGRLDNSDIRGCSLLYT